ncbi:MAG TPA: response regulator [Candidatus Xenobia bacterium]|jgi:two-component system cell cycle response regulator
METAGGGNGRILVVEDSATQARTFQHTLESAGYHVEVARDVQEARTRLHENRYDVVLSDILMPGDSGYDLCKEIKSDAQLKELPVVLVTSLRDPMDIVQGLECGADNFLVKPVDPVYLLNRIDTVLKIRAGEVPEGSIISFMGKPLQLSHDRQQIFSLLLSTCEDIVRKNQELKELSSIRTQLEEYARRLQDKLRNQVVRYRLLLEKAGDAVLVLDAVGAVTEANGLAAQLWGQSEGDLKGHLFSDLVDLGQSITSLVSLKPQTRMVTTIKGSKGKTIDFSVARVDTGEEEPSLVIVAREVETSSERKPATTASA